MKKKEIEEYIKSKSVTQNTYVAPTVQTHVDTRAPAMAAVSVQPTVSQTRSNLKSAETAFDTASENYQNALSREYKKNNVDFSVKFDKPNLDIKDTTGFPTRTALPQIDAQKIEQSRAGAQKELDEKNKAFRNWQMANYENNLAEVANEKTSLWDKTGGQVTRALKDLVSPLFTGEENQIVDEKGNKTFLPTRNELKQQAVQQSYGDNLAGKAAKFAGDVLYGGTKMLGAQALNAVTGGIGGNALYWTDMATDNFKNTKNEGYSDTQAFSKAAVDTGIQFLTAKLLGGATSKLTGGKIGKLEELLNVKLNNVISNPEVSRYIASMGSEGTEELLEDWIGLLTDRATLGKEITADDVADTLKQSISSFATGAATAGLVEGVNTASSSITNNFNQPVAPNMEQATQVETQPTTQEQVREPAQQVQETKPTNNMQTENLAEEKAKEPVLKVETTGEKGKQYWKQQGASEEVAKVMSEMPKVEKKSIGEKIKEGKASLREEASYFKRNLVDKGETIYKISKKTKNPNLYAKYDKRGTTTGEANYDIGKAQTNLNGKSFENFTDENGKKTSMSLNKIWEGVDNQAANEYLAHWLNVDRYNQVNEDGTGKYVFGTPDITPEISQQKIAELEKQHPELKRFGENVWQYGKNQLQNMVDSGKISQEQANQFLQDTPHYVRLQRNVEKSSRPLLEFDRKGNAKVNKNIKEFKGSNIDILPFKESMAQYTLDVRNSIRDNIFAQELAKTLGIGSEGEAISNIEDIMGVNDDLLKDNGDGTYSLTFFNKGVATTIPIDEGIYESLQPNKHYKFEDKLLFKGIRKIDSARKALLTDKNPMFLATNMMKDAFDAPLNSKYPALFVKNYPRAVSEILNNGEYYQQYQALGGLQNTYFDKEGFQKEGSKYNPLTWVEKANNAIEQFPRLAEFISTMERTGDIDQAMYNAAEITTNFKRGGDIAKAANRNGATFLNASIQGFDKQIRNFTDIQNPQQAVQLLGKIVALGIVPGLINDLMWDDDDEYKEMQDYQKDRYYLFKGKNGEWIRIPKGRAISVFQSAARRAKYTLQGEEDAFAGFGKFASDQVAPNNPFENNIISPIVNVSRNESWSGSKIIPQSMEKKKAEKQYNEKTDKLSRAISETVNKSELAKKVIPKNFRSAMGINYLIDQYSGAIGDVGLPYITPKASSKSSNPITAPVRDKFTTDAVYSNKNVGTFYDTMTRLAEEDETPLDKAKNSYMTSKSIELSGLYQKQREIQNNDKLSKSEKYDKAREVQKEINNFTKDTVKNINNVENEEYYLKIGDYYYKKVIKDGEEKYVRDTSKKIPTEKYALYDYFKEKYEKSKEDK